MMVKLDIPDRKELRRNLMENVKQARIFLKKTSAFKI